MRKCRLILIVFVFISTCLAGQGLYDIDKLTKVEIWFKESNWNDLLNQYKKNELDQYLLGKVKINGVLLDSVGVKYKGTSSFNVRNKKNPLNLDLNLAKEQDFQGFKTLKLSNGYFDPSFIREVLAYSILKKYMKVPDCNYAMVYINDKYHGLYANVEAINKDFVERNFYLEPKNAMFKCNPKQWGVFTSSLEYLGPDSLLYADKYELKTPHGWQGLIDLTYCLANPKDKFENWLDVDACLWMLAFNNVTVNLDSYTGPLRQNYYLFQNAANQMVPIPWDMNMCFGGYNNTGFPEDTIGRKNLVELKVNVREKDKSYPLISSLFTNPTFKKMYLAHVKTILKENFVNGWYKRVAEILQKQITKAYEEDQNRFYSQEDFEKNLYETVGGTTLEETIGIAELCDYRTAFLTGQPWYQDTAPVIEKYIIPSEAFPNENMPILVYTQNTSEVYLMYRNSDFEPFKQMLLYDDGKHNDLDEGDGVFGLEIPVNYTRIDFYLYAQNDRAGVFAPERNATNFYSIDVNLKESLVINEVLASNKNGKENENGKKEDWIELYNNSSGSIDLEGWALSDDPLQLKKWKFPAGTKIKEGEYLIVWADKKGERKKELHANFKLSAKGEIVILSKPDGSVVDEIVFGKQKQDISYARVKNGTGKFKSAKPTFNSNNDEVVGTQKQLKKPLFRVFPNPAKENIFVVYNDSLPVKVELFSSMGTLVYTYNLSDTKSSLNVTGLNKGVYMLKIKDQSLKLSIAY